jgi:hypothetical protein
MTSTPDYVVHSVDEKDITVDWFFGDGHVRTKVVQSLLALLGWCFVMLPVFITSSSIVNRETGSGWWAYQEGFVMWVRTMAFLGILTVIFIVGFLVLYLVNRALRRRDDGRITYDEERLDVRTQVADDWYLSKFGPESMRRERRSVRVEPYVDLETFELRGLYRTHEVD